MLQTVDVGHTGRLTGVVHTDGGIFTCSTDNSVKVVDPVLEPSIIAQLNVHAAPVARVSARILMLHIPSDNMIMQMISSDNLCTVNVLKFKH